MKYTFLLSFIVLLSCTSNSSALQENESILVGTWLESADNGPVKGFYMEFHEDRTGILGPVIEIEGKTGLNKFTTLLMKDWRIEKDTLSIQMEMQAGLVAYGPDGEKIEQSDKPSYEHFIIWELSDTLIVLENLIDVFPGRDVLTRSKKMKLIDHSSPLN
ncbi:MAG: hypothetical protein AAF487_09375 [Bacteroidota bacterium]